MPTVEASDFALVPAEIEARITPRTKVLVLITPNNPTGAVTPPPAIREIAEICKQHDIVVISDEIYARIIFEGSEHLSIGTPARDAGAHDHAQRLLEILRDDGLAGRLHRRSRGVHQARWSSRATRSRSTPTRRPSGRRWRR